MGIPARVDECSLFACRGALPEVSCTPLFTIYDDLEEARIYTGITRGKRLLVLIGQKKALGIAVRNDRPQRRYSGLLASLRNNRRTTLA